MDQRVLVTAGARWIGREIARAANGAKVFVFRSGAPATRTLGLGNCKSTMWRKAVTVWSSLRKKGSGTNADAMRNSPHAFLCSTPRGRCSSPSQAMTLAREMAILLHGDSVHLGRKVLRWGSGYYVIDVAVH